MGALFFVYGVSEDGEVIAPFAPWLRREIFYFTSFTKVSGLRLTSNKATM